MPTPRVTIDQLPEQAAPEDANLLVVHDGDTTKKMTIATLKTIETAGLSVHIADPTGAHAATAISATDSGAGVNGADVQAQLGQLAGRTDAASGGLAAHLADTDDAHDASAISAVPHSGVSATHVQGQLEQLSTALAMKDVVWVGPDAPTDPIVEMWWDADAPATYLPTVPNQFATNDETIVGAIADKAVTPAGLNVAVSVEDVRRGGVVGNGVVDDGAALNAFLAANAGKTIVIPAGLTVRTTVPITVPSNTVLHGYGAKLTSAIPGVSDRLLIVDGVANVVIAGLELDGAKASFAPVTEHRHGIHITNSTKIILRDIHSHDNKGDGLYIGSGVTGLSEDIVVNSCRFIANHRNNCSVTHARGIKFFGCTFNAASGTAPQAGVDVEPNAITDIVEDIQFFGCIAQGNAKDGFLVVGYTAATAAQRNIGFYGCTAKANSQSGFSLTRPIDVRIEGGATDGNTSHGLALFGPGRNVRINIDASNNGMNGLAGIVDAFETLIIGGTYWHNGATTPGTYSGISFGSGVVNSRIFLLPGTVCGGPSAGARQGFGLYVTSTTNVVTAVDCLFFNNTVLQTNIASGGFIELNEMVTPPVAGAANSARLFLKDNGSGKTQLMAQFATGAAVQIGIQP